MAAGKHGGGNHLAFDRLPPDWLAGAQLEAAEVMPMVAIAVGVSHEDSAPRDGRHAHQWVAEPRLPGGRSVDRENLELAALGVEHNETLVDDRRGRPIVRRLVLPREAAGVRVEGEEVVAAEAAADEHA